MMGLERKIDARIFKTSLALFGARITRKRKNRKIKLKVEEFLKKNSLIFNKLNQLDNNGYSILVEQNVRVQIVIFD